MCKQKRKYIFAFEVICKRLSETVSSLGKKERTVLTLKERRAEVEARKKGEELFENSIARDLVGVERDGRTENIATKYWQFVGMLNKKINRQGDVS